MLRGTLSAGTLAAALAPVWSLKMRIVIWGAGVAEGFAEEVAGGYSVGAGTPVSHPLVYAVEVGAGTPVGYPLVTSVVDGAAVEVAQGSVTSRRSRTVSHPSTISVRLESPGGVRNTLTRVVKER